MANICNCATPLVHSLLLIQAIILHAYGSLCPRKFENLDFRRIRCIWCCSPRGALDVTVIAVDGIGVDMGCILLVSVVDRATDAFVVVDSAFAAAVDVGDAAVDAGDVAGMGFGFTVCIWC